MVMIGGGYDFAVVGEWDFGGTPTEVFGAG